MTSLATHLCIVPNGNERENSRMNSNRVKQIYVKIQFRDGIIEYDILSDSEFEDVQSIERFFGNVDSAEVLAGENLESRIFSSTNC